MALNVPRRALDDVSWNLDARLNGRALRGLPADTGNVFVTAAGLEPA
jgi:hypothetical protein